MASSWLKEIGLAFGVVGGLLLVLTMYTGVWPPLVVVESGSMMHPDEDNYGNLGTIDPGDLVLVKDVSDRGDVELFVDGADGRYGRSGDVVVYYPENDRRRTPIIHRAMTWVEVPDGSDGPPCVVKWFDGDTRSCDPDGTLTIERWGIRNWEPQHSGFITLGDNNDQADQATGRVGGAVRMSWVQGQARAEIPWIGLIKLSVSPTPNQYNAPADWVKIGNAYAPADLWVMLGVSLVGLFVAPMGVEAGVGFALREYRRRDGSGDPPDPPEGPGNPGHGEPPTPGDPSDETSGGSRVEPFSQEAEEASAEPVPDEAGDAGVEADEGAGSGEDAGSRDEPS